MPRPKKEPVEIINFKSSFIKTFVYFNTSRTLRVIFTDGQIYDYYGITQHRVDRAKASESIGNFFNREIRGKFY